MKITEELMVDSFSSSTVAIDIVYILINHISLLWIKFISTVKTSIVVLWEISGWLQALCAIEP